MAFPDSAAARERYFTELITAPRPTALAFGSRIEEGAERRVLVRSVARGEDFLIEFIPERNGAFSEAGFGSWIIQRGGPKAYLLQAKIFLRDDPGCYLRLYPQAEGTRVDLVMYGAVLKKGLYIPNLFYYVLKSPFSSIMESTRRSIEWAALFAAPDPEPPSAERLARIEGWAAGAASAEARLASTEEPELSATELVSVTTHGMSDDRDVLVPRTPYQPMPAYAPGRGAAPSAVKTFILLDLLAHPGSVYLLLGAGGAWALAVPDFQRSGGVRLSYRRAGEEGAAVDIDPGLGGSPVRVFRIPKASAAGAEG